VRSTEVANVGVVWVEEWGSGVISVYSLWELEVFVGVQWVSGGVRMTCGSD